MRARKRQAERRGRQAEALALWWLRAKGYRIHGRRVRLPEGEIDLIAERSGVIAFVEVKARANLDLGLESVAPRQQARIAAAAERWMARHATPGKGARFDVIVASPKRPPRHVRDAWRP